MDTPTILVGYAEAHAKAAFFLQEQPGYFKISGPDRHAFLQRQTTNDIRLLGEQKSLVTVLTDPQGRILDVFRLVSEPAETIGALTLPGRGPGTGRYLKSRIFFNDKVSLEDASAAISMVELHGATSGELLLHLGLPHIPALDEVVKGNIGRVPATIIGQAGFSTQGFTVLVTAGNKQSLLAALQELGAVRLPAETYHVLRVEAGLPAGDAELKETYTPLETGLEAAISSTKGCYTGQEVIARQVTYDKVTQHLVGLRLQAPASPGERIWAGGKPAGSVTSYASSPTFGPIALAIIKRPHHQPGARVIISAVKEGEGNPALVTGLPFTVHESIH